MGIAVLANQKPQHADNLGAFLVNRGGVEIIDLDIFFGPYGMRQWTGILAELARAQLQNVGNALHRFAALIARELLIAEYGQPFLQTQLKPVAAGDPVTSPVVKILVRDDAFDQFIITVGRRFGTGQNVFGIKDVQALIFHRAHIEIVDRDDHEQVQVVFTAVFGFIPAHRPDKRVHGVGAFVLITVAHIDFQVDFAARHSGEGVVIGNKITGNQREQVGRFWPWVLPLGKAFAVRGRIAVRQQNRHIAFDPDAERRHHIGAVRIVGDLAESLGLALGAIHAI